MNSEQRDQGRYQLELSSTDMLVPQDHLLRLIEEHIDFSFIVEKTKPYYTAVTGRPPIPPIRLFKMMLIGYLYAIRSERQLECEIQVNIAYRWFLGLGLTERVPDHSTISHNRNERFKGSDLFQEIFDELVKLAIGHRMVAGRLLLTDATHIRADANNNRYEMLTIEEFPRTYLKELEAAVQEDRIQHGKEPLPPEKKPEDKLRKISLTDPESGFMTRLGKPEGFHYLEHRTVDHKYGIITDAFITAGTVNEPVVYIDRLQRQIETFGFNNLESVAMDSGYMTPYVCKKTLDMDIFPAIANRKRNTPEDVIPKAEFIYDPQQNAYRCPQGQTLPYYTTARNGHWIYYSDPAQCADCPILNQCTTSQKKKRVIERHIWDAYCERVQDYTATPVGQRLLRMRQQKIEPSFGEAKVLHQYRRCKFRGRAKTQEQALLTAFTQNLKKIVRHLAAKARRVLNGPNLYLFRLFFMLRSGFSTV